MTEEGIEGEGTTTEGTTEGHKLQSHNDLQAAIDVVRRGHVDREYLVRIRLKSPFNRASIESDFMTVERGVNKAHHWVFTDSNQAQDCYHRWMGSGTCRSVELQTRPDLPWITVAQYDARFWNPDGSRRDEEPGHGYHEAGDYP